MKTSKIVLFAALFLILFGVIFILIVNDSYKYKITYNVNGIENIFYYNINLLPMD